MKNKIPFSLVPFNTLKNISKWFSGIANKLIKYFPFIEQNMEYIQVEATAKEYLAMIIMNSIISFAAIFILLSVTLFFVKIENSLLISIIISIPITIFLFAQQILYPKIRAGKKIVDVERNLLPALQDMLVQLNSGIPLFRVIVDISTKDYGEISKKFANAVNEINVGVPQIDVLEEMASKSSSLYLRKAIWQIVNGMKTGANTTIVLKEVISSLSEEQLIQVQRYASQLNPLVMFYMIITIILPSLGMTFLTVITSFIATSESLPKTIFIGFYIVIFFFQIMFLGMIKSRRPTLLENR
ncbi:type II secretion system F family protein [Candidatus Woesearchaeota archaeon]|nr:type II secretion system F family protein [Candidatus Woesearchaeota archaeon]